MPDPASLFPLKLFGVLFVLWFGNGQYGIALSGKYYLSVAVRSILYMVLTLPAILLLDAMEDRLAVNILPTTGDHGYSHLIAILLMWITIMLFAFRIRKMKSG